MWDGEDGVRMWKIENGIKKLIKGNNILLKYSSIFS